VLWDLSSAKRGCVRRPRPARGSAQAVRVAVDSPAENGRPRGKGALSRAENLGKTLVVITTPRSPASLGVPYRSPSRCLSLAGAIHYRRLRIGAVNPAGARSAERVFCYYGPSA